MCEQPPYSMLVRGIEADVLPTCGRYGMGVIPWSPLAGGWLSGRWRKGQEAPTSSRAERLPQRFDLSLPGNQRKLEAAEALAQLAEEAGMTLIELAIAFVIRHPAVTRRSSARARWSSSSPSSPPPTSTLTDDVLDRIDEIVPPGHEPQPGRRRLVEPGARAGRAAPLMAKRSAGILLYRERDGAREVLLVHPGGPFWAQARTPARGRSPRASTRTATTRARARCASSRRSSARRSRPAPSWPSSATVRQTERQGHHRLRAPRATSTPTRSRSNTFTIEWPPRSGRTQEFPEVDRAGWFGLDEAREKLNPAQAELWYGSPHCVDSAGQPPAP